MSNSKSDVYMNRNIKVPVYPGTGRRVMLSHPDIKKKLIARMKAQKQKAVR